MEIMRTSQQTAFESFVSDVRDVIAGVADPRQQADRVVTHLEGLLREPRWLEPLIEWPAPDDYRFRNFVLHRDEVGFPSGGSGFMVLGHSVPPWQASPIHDHGPCWVIYGIYEGRAQLRRSRIERVGGPSEAFRIEEVERTSLGPGQALAFYPGDAHDIRSESPGKRFVLRITSQDLSKVEKYVYQPQLYTRRASSGD